MTKKQLVARLAKDNELSQKDAGKALDMVLNGIMNATSEGEDVNILGFGSFKSKTRAARESKIPGTDKVVQVPESVVVSFKAGKAFKEALNK